MVFDLSLLSTSTNITVLKYLSKALNNVDDIHLMRSSVLFNFTQF